MDAYWGGEVQLHALSSVLYWGEWSALRAGRFIPRERDSGTHWRGPRAGLDAVKKKKIPKTMQTKCTNS
jgi:hypothetical protein